MSTPLPPVPLTRRIRHVRKVYPNMTSQPVLDVGCGIRVPHLRHFGPGSVGIDGQDVSVPEDKFFLRWNFEDDIRTRLEEAGLQSQFKYVWCADVFEHVLSPHEFLLNLRRTLLPDGMLCLGVPLINIFGMLPKARNTFLNYFYGYLSQDHINFFTFRTLKYTVEFAGFELVDWYSPFALGMKRPPRIGIEPLTTFFLRPIPNFQYGPKAVKELVEGRLVWKEHIAAH